MYSQKDSPWEASNSCCEYGNQAIHMIRTERGVMSNILDSGDSWTQLILICT